MGRTTGIRCARTSPRRPPSAGSGPAFGRRLRAALGTRRLRVAIVAAALVAAVAAAVLIGLPRAPGPEAVSAAAVLERALSAVSSGRTWQADVMMKAADWNRSLSGYHYDVWRYHIVQSTDGSYLLTQLGPTRRVGSGARHEPARDRRRRLRRLDRRPPSPQAGAAAVGGRATPRWGHRTAGPVRSPASTSAPPCGRCRPWGR